MKDVGGNCYQAIQNVMTAKGARAMALDEKTHTVFLSTVKLGPQPVPTPHRAEGLDLPNGESGLILEAPCTL